MKYSFLTRKTLNPTGQFYLHMAILAALITIVYYPTLDAPFVFDDFPNIVMNPAVHPGNFRDLFSAFHSEFSASRPLAMLSFALNYLFGGLDVYGYHIVNIVLHILNALLLYNILIIFPVPAAAGSPEIDTRDYRRNLAFWATALWAMNPIQTQAVTYIVQRMTSMASLFYLAGIYVFISRQNKRLPKHIAIFLIITFFILGMGCKEIVITLPFTLLLIDYLFYSKKITKYHLLVMGFVIVGLIGAFFFYLNGKLPDFFNQYPNRNFSPWERVMTEWRVVWHYLSLYFLPLPHRMHLAYDVEISKNFLTPWTTITSLLTILASWFLAWKYRFKFPVLSFAWIFFFLALTLESTFLSLEIAFAHRLYLPTVFIIFSLLACIPQNIFKKTTIFFLLLLGLWSFWAISRNDEWNNSNNFWEKELRRGSSPARALNNQGAALIETGQYNQAISLFNEALKLARGNDRKLLLYNLGMTYFYLKEYDKAVDAEMTLVKEFGSYEYTYLFIGQGLLALNKVEKARKLADILTKSKDLSFFGMILKSNILRNQKKYSAAEKILKDTINKTPKNMTDRHQKLKLEIAIVYILSNKIEEAYKTYQEIIELYPDNYFAWQQIYRMLVAGHDQKNAEKILLFLRSKGFDIKEN